MITVPFDFNPASVDVKIASFNIPAGQYAYVIPACEDADFTIDGTIASLRSRFANQGDFSAMQERCSDAGTP